jgi:hypothetical protein
MAGTGLKMLVVVVVLALVVLMMDFNTIRTDQTDCTRLLDNLPREAPAERRPRPAEPASSGTDAEAGAAQRRGPHTEVDCREHGSFCIYTNLCYDGEAVPRHQLLIICGLPLE